MLFPELKIDWVNALFEDKKIKLYVTQRASQQFRKMEMKKRDRRKLAVENHYHHHHQEALMAKMTMMTNHELKHNERS